MPLSKKKKVKKSASSPPSTSSNGEKLTQMDDLRAVFAFFDRNQNGNIEADELGEVMSSLGYQATEEELNDMINEADKDGNKMIDFDEFVQMMEAKCRRDQDQEDELREAFKVFDCDGNGFISREELAKVMKNIGEDLSEDDLTEMITEADKNGDGVIDFQEFTQMLSRNVCIKPMQPAAI